MSKVLNINGNEYIEIEDKKVVYNNNKYSIYEVGGCTELNTIAIDGNTLGLKRIEYYEGNEIGYVVEATRINDKTFKCDTIWLQVEDKGWSEAETINNENEIAYIQNIFKKANMKLVI